VYALSNKQLKSLQAGHPVSVALPPIPAMLDAADNWTVNEDRLLRWAREQFVGHSPTLVSASVVRASLQTIWLDCSGGDGGLTEYYGRIVPNIERHSKMGLPPIPVSVVVCNIGVPDSAEVAGRIQWPVSYTSPSGYGYGGVHEDRFVPVADPA